MLLTRREDQVIEALLSHEEVADPEFADLSRVLEAVGRAATVTGFDDKAAEFAVTAARIARSGEGGNARRIRPLYRPLVPRLATAALAGVLVVGMTGVAAASDAAAPGDFLYGIDRALERVGVNDGGISERIAEANVLVAGGSPSRALDHLAESMGSMSAGAAAALHDAADKIRHAGSDSNSSQEVRDQVADILEWMSASDLSGPDFGKGVAEHARGIGRSSFEPPDQPGPTGADEVGGGNGRGNGNGPPGGTPPGQRSP